MPRVNSKKAGLALQKLSMKKTTKAQRSANATKAITARWAKENQEAPVTPPSS